MIQSNFILEWANTAPWQELSQIEHDLIITKAILELYANPEFGSSMAFRGGTALNKLFFNQFSRYSEDIDFVQLRAEPIGPILNLIQSALDPWLGKPKKDFSTGLVTLTYRIISTDGAKLKLKVEINTREHFTILGLQDYQFSSNSSWCPGSALITTYQLEELLGTKMRALYQRRKGRDLYDLYKALMVFPEINKELIIQCFKEYMQKHIPKAIYLKNIEDKLKLEEFRNDILPLLPKSDRIYDSLVAYEYIYKELLVKLD